MLRRIIIGCVDGYRQMEAMMTKYQKAMIAILIAIIIWKMFFTVSN